VPALSQVLDIPIGKRNGRDAIKYGMRFSVEFAI
jgi:hypothetical protein